MVDDLGEGFGLTAQAQSPIDPQRICGYLQRALEELVVALERSPTAPVRELDVLPARERDQLLSGWNRGLSYAKGALLHERFEAQAARTPGAVAVVFEGERVSYGELNARANRLAHRLRELGVVPDQLVGLRVERGVEMVVGLLGILKAGGAYLPLDPAYPKERIAFMLEDSAVGIVLTQKALLPDLAGLAVRTVLLDEPLAGPETNPAPLAGADNLAYVIYTSGSTGKPKGAQITHYNVTRLFEATEAWYRFNQDDVWTLFHSYAFDFSVWELWGALLYGGRVVIVPYMTSRSPEEFRELLIRERVTVLNQTPSAFRQLMQADLAQPKAELALRYVIFGGEALELQSLRPWFERYGDERPLLVNMYGITETTVHVTYRPIRLADLDSGQGSVIGEPIPDLRLYILDAHQEPTPIGVPGEMYVGGAGVARGYLNREELTAQRFVPDPFTPTERASTARGISRRLANGDIEYLGRIDSQVKIRGFRIELGEIESALGSHPAVREAVVLAREDTPGDKRLVAYVVAPEAPADLTEALRAHIRTGLPEYMVPAHFVTLEALPLTENGKVDRKALPAPEHSGSEAEYVAPRNATEESLAQIWTEVLKLERVGIHDNFFELGGHSLLAVTLIERMRRAGLNADVRALFATPTVAELALAAGGESGEVEVPPEPHSGGLQAITPEMLPLVTLTPEEIARIAAQVPGGAKNIQDIYPLAPLQEGILFHHLMAREGDPYLLYGLTAFDSRARLESYLKALQSVIDRHDILRTAVLTEGLAEPVQVVWRTARLKVEEVSLNPAQGDVAEQLHARYGPRRYRIDVREAPLLRVFIAQDQANGRWVMLQLSHHLAIDHMAADVVQQEVRAYLLGQGDQLPAPLPFRNFVAQARLGIKREEHEAYFKELLGDVEEPTAPFGLTDVQGDGTGITEARRLVDPQLAKRLRDRSRALGVSAAALCHLAYGQVLSRTAGRDDVVFGTVLFGRMQGGEGAERVLGLFINTLPVRIRVAEAGVEGAVKSTHAQLAQLLRHEHASLALAQRASRVAAPAPLFSSLLNYRHIAAASHVSADARRAGEGIRHLGGEERTNYPLVVSVDDFGEGLGLTAKVQSPLDPERICGYMERALEELVTALERSPATPLHGLDILPAPERRQLLVEWNDTKVDYPAHALTHELFEAQAARTPEAVALEFEGRELSYKELNARANQLARVLRKKGVTSDALVGVYAERSFEMVVALLAVLKAGGAYVPLDPEYPQERLAHMLEDARVSLVLAQSNLASELPAGAAERLVLDSAAYAAEPRGNLEKLGTPQSLAYVIFTSGSTGRPKGAMNEHRGIVNRLLDMQAQYPLSADDVLLQKTPYGFDVSVWEFFWPLMAGARLVIARPEGHRDASYLARVIRERGVTTAHFVPSMLRVFLQEQGVEGCRSVKRVYSGGEALTRELQELFFARLPGAELYNLYGPAEAAVDVTAWACRRGDTQLTVPIGRPLANTTAYVLDSRLRPVPAGVAGELHIGGVQVGRGYVGRPDLTAERFVPDPFTPGGRLYKTGDLARHLPDGAIEYLGRTDFQVKIRGQRIELGEIEATLDRHPGVAQSVVMAREDTPGDQRLVAYIVAKAEAPAATELKEHLASQLPPYMVPAAFVTLPAFPLTSSGKVDRKALPAPERTGLEAEYVAPRNATEEKLAQIWAEVLKVERVGVQDNFFELGGHSLLAVSLIERMRRAGLHADVRALFTTSTLAELALAVGGESGEVKVPPNRIPPECEAITPEMLPLVTLTPEEIARIVAQVPGGARNIQDIYPLAPLQEGILFHHLMAREGDPYLLRALYSFDNRGRLKRYLEALQAVIDRHDILRTGVLWEGLAEPVQVVWRRAQLRAEEVSLDPAQGDIARQLAARFDPRRYRLDIDEAPLLKIFFAEDRANARWVMLLLLQHLVSDHTALEVVQEEVQAYLLDQAAKLPAPLPFRNFVAQARLGVPREEHEAYFKNLLGDVEEPTAPFGLADVQGDGSGITEARRVVDPQLAKRLRERSRALGVSAAALCHLAYAQVLARTSGRDDVVFGTVLFGRMQGGEGAERVLGLFINTLPVRIRVGEAGVEASVKSTHAQLAQLLRHEHASLALAQRCSAVAAPAPLFSSFLNYRHIASAVQTAQGRQAWEGIRYLGGEERTNYPLVLAVDDLGEGLRLTAQAQSPVDPQRVCAYMHRALEELVAALENAPGAPLRSLDVLPDEERRRLLEEWSGPHVEYPADASLHSLFEAQVRRTPDAVAVVFEDEWLSYRDLDARANRLARHLGKHGVGRDTPVALCAERSLEMVVGMLGILKAGGAYVPIDPDLPRERAAYMLDETQSPVVLIQQRFQSRIPPVPGRATVCLDADWPAIAREVATPVPGEATATDIAYVIYTSGSTGRPKGVMVPHSAICNHMLWMQRVHPLGQEEAVLQKTPFGFDASVWEFFAPLLAGARLVMARPGGHLDPDYLVRTILAQKVSTLQLVPSQLRMLLAEPGFSRCAPPLRHVYCGGEPLTRDLCDAVRAKLPQARLHNLYGPTEATIDATSWDCPAAEAPAVIPIGSPIDNVRAYVVSPQMQLSPVGVPGEIFIGGAGLARGYLKQLELTAERFMPDPFNPGGRLYKTGDLARHLPDGAIEYLGRTDFQVKIRGQRIELGEIEAVLDKHPAVGQSVVMAREDTPGDQRLVAYVVAKAEAPGAPELKEHLASQLPQYMVPAAFVTLEAFPLTSSGKVDRKALPAPDGAAYATRGYEAPVGEVEEKLAGIWAEVLKLERVGRHDNFFELGGHSLLAITLIERMRRAGLHAQVRALFVTPTLAELALAMGGESGLVEVPPNGIPADCAAITPEMLPLVTLTPGEIARIVAQVPGGARNIQDIYPLAPLQEGILFHHLMAREGDPYLLRALYSFDNRGRLKRYLEALQAVIDRHDILRTAVMWEGLTGPVQVVWRKALVKVEDVSLDAANGDVARQLAERFDPRRYRIDIGEAPLLKIFFAEDRATARWVMVLLFHHLVSDHTTLEMMQHEVQTHLLGQAEKLPVPLPFRNFVAQARLGVKREEHEAYFKELLGDVEEPTAPFGLIDIQSDGSGITEARQAVEPQLAKRLRERARALGVSAAALCHLAYAQVLARTAGRDDVVFGTVLFGRMQGGEGAERVLGLFINTLPVRIRVGEAGVEASVKSTHAQLAQLLRHEHASLALAQRCSAVAAPAPLFSSLLNYRHIASAAQTGRQAWEGMRALGGEERTNYPLVLSVNDLGEALGLTAQAQSPLDPARICGYMQRALEELVSALEKTPATPLRALEILPAPERRQLLQAWTDTGTAYPREASIAQLFEAQAKRTPDAVALEHEGETLTYKELNARANRLAHYLAKQGVGRETMVGLCVERSLEMVVATLAILKAGGAYVPLDPEYPKDRLAFMLEDTGAPVLLTQERLRERLPAYTGKVIELDADWKRIARESAVNPKAQASAQSLAYVIYTSGSTGRPKGTAVEQGSVVRLVSNTNYIELGPEEVFLQFAPISFDASTLEIWGPLLNGAKLVVAPAGRLSLEELAALIKERGITTLWLTAALFHQMVDSHREALRGVKQLLAGGEALSVPHVRRFLEGIGKNRLINGYGPTENTTFTCCHVMTADTCIGHTVPIGRPIANTRVYILDSHLNPAPVGVVGELYAGGAGLARGYLNQPELTQEKFVPDPFTPGERLYRTGDLVRYTPEGVIEFVGRIDSQVKVRGYRIELGEIEAVLGSHPAVKETVVLAREDTPGDKRLVAYVVGEASAAELKEHLASRLPSYMLPAAFVTLEKLPLTPNDKVDRKALPAPERTGLEAGYVAPRNATEEILAGIWAEVLKVERVGIHDNFFELGGHSLLATQVVSRINQKFNLSIPLRVIFEESTLAGIASYIEMLHLSRKVDEQSGDPGETERIRI